ncbi:aminoglycoside phosphotransferase family protein [Kitasatospora sp. NA04385]|uniref:phosphotransferase n=1 Tax=Kitasatospora sp. NA04385 TaxID=2742135 RepID=UPI001591F166|nr:aminoglycoside phosphotransferase family protein [Kitasatospora sp. NA04385]QKW23594.1 aminoglycoside phosphotransferase family protein [Kitasatospora sp. NA04385]
MDIDQDAVAAAFGLGRPLGPWRRLDNGGAPTDGLLLETSRGRWTVRTGRLRSEWHREQAHRVHRLQRAALAAGVAMPRPVEPPAPALGYWHHPGGDTLVKVNGWLDGHDLRRPGADLAGAADWTGRTLARIAALDTGGEQPPPPHPVAQWREWVAEAEAGGLPVAGPARALLPAVAEAVALVRDAQSGAPAAVLVHGDTSRANVLRTPGGCTPGGYALIDWESVQPEVPWWEAVSVAFRFATPFNGAAVDPDPRVVRPLLAAYLDAGGPGVPADASAFAGLLRSQLSTAAWCLWLALGHREADAAQRAFGLRIVTDTARELPLVLGGLTGWAALLR